MKSIFIILLFLPILSMAQDCKLSTATDDFTHETKISTPFITLNAGADKILLSVDATGKEIDFFFAMNNPGDGKCFDNSSTASLYFDGTKSKANFRNTGSMNCQGLFHFTFRNLAATPAALQRLANQKISSIQLNGNNKTEIIITLKEEQKQLFQEMVTCIIRESKKLIK